MDSCEYNNSQIHVKNVISSRKILSDGSYKSSLNFTCTREIGSSSFHACQSNSSVTSRTQMRSSRTLFAAQPLHRTQFKRVIRHVSKARRFRQTPSACRSLSNGHNTRLINRSADPVGSFTVTCSHSRSYQLYTDSVYRRKSLVAVRFPSRTDFKIENRANHTTAFMGHDASFR